MRSAFRAGYIESWGRGIEKMNRACIQHGSKPPEYDFGMAGLMLTMRATAPIEPSANHGDAVLAAAREYVKRGYAVVPVPTGQKGPILPGWPNLRLAEAELPQAFQNAGNLGILLGEPSGHLVDIDLDCPEARELADKLLPATGAITGRPGAPASHRWYICPDLQTTRHRDPVTQASIVELRATGSQTLVGPSIHPSGEQYDALAGEPAQVDAATLSDAVRQLASKVVQARHGELAAPPVVPAHHATSSLPGDNRDILDRASAYLGAMPPAISGQGGHDDAYAAATALVHGFGLREDDALKLLRQEYNPRCQPPWSDKELAHKVHDAATQPHDRPQGWLLERS